MSRAHLVALVFFLTSWLSSCARKGAPTAGAPVLDEIEVHLARVVPPTLAVPAEAQLAELVRQAAEQVAGPLTVTTKAAPPGRPSLRLIVELELGWAAEKGDLRSLIRARLEPKGSAAAKLVRIDREALVEKEGIASVPDAKVIQAHLVHAFSLTVGGVMRAEQLWLGTPSAARAALTGADEELRDEAIRIAAERRDREALPSLLPLLKTEDPELRDRAIGALAEIGDPRAAKALAELAKFGDLREMPKILDAISRVGGPEAASYLEFVSGGHPNAEIRDLAKRALEHLRAREK